MESFKNEWNWIFAAVERVRNSTSATGFAFIGDATDIRYLEMTNCDLQVVGEEFSRKPYAIAVQQGSPLKDQFNNAWVFLFHFSNNNSVWNIIIFKKINIQLSIQNSAIVEQTVFGETKRGLVERQEEMRKSRGSIGWYFDTEYWRRVHCHLRRHWYGLHYPSVWVLVVQISQSDTKNHKCHWVCHQQHR